MIVIGIDPGAQTGCAVYVNGKLSSLKTFTPLGILDYLYDYDDNLTVVIEDSRLQSHVFTATGQNRQAGMKIARNIGMIDAYCALICGVCEEMGFNCISISPKDKGRKFDDAEFNAFTGWHGQSNQHSRDAAIVAWRFRNIAKLA